MGIISDLLNSGQYTTSKNPWMSGKLAAVARQYGFKVKQDVIIKKTPPWAKARGHLNAMTPAQLEAIRTLAELAHSLAGTGRMTSVEVKAQLSGRSYGGMSAAERRQLKSRLAEANIAKIRKLLAEKGRGVRAVAAPGAAAPQFD